LTVPLSHLALQAEVGDTERVKSLRALLLLLITASPLAAQRSLHWREVRVDATLATGGALRVRETQTIVFTGDWNGGERRFDVRPRQRLEFVGMQRLDSAGRAHEMRAGDLSVVDGYDFTDPRTLRWRSRLPSDAPFNATVITYVLQYSLSNILVPDGDNWILDHDFGFADRSGLIENFAVRLDLEPEWQPTIPFAGTWQARNLPPGEGFVVHVPMRYAGEGEVSGVDPGADPVERGLLAIVSLILLGSIGKRLYTRERSTGRLDPLPPPVTVDETWLQEHVFKHLPEVIGAAWDNKTEASEVTAVLARLVSEGRMKSEVTPGGMFEDPVLHLELLVDRNRFHGYEQRLIDALFAAGERTTDTASIRKRYKKSGFDPAEKIRKPLKDLVKSLVPGGDPSRPPALPSLLAFLGAIVLLGIALTREPADASVVFLTASLTMVCYVVAVIGAASWRNRVHNVRGAALWFLVPMAVALWPLVFLVVTGVSLASTLTLSGLTLLFLALANSVFNQARSRENQERIAFRRRLATARGFFVEELRRDQPRLKDAWFPYLIAFGLGKQMDKWFHAFGAETVAAVGHAGYSSGSGGGTGSSGGGWTGFGGGGGFSGGGASASWAAAAGSMAAGVSAPSSSSSGSSGGGGGGGGSSGGGGGGGW
jgi:uncharacterized membrane protein YgcG